jgi:hypothetical protein
MKNVFLALLISTIGPISAYACRCVNTSGNPIYDQQCATAQQFGVCKDYPNICTPVASCVNVSGNPVYDQQCSTAD